MGFTRQTTRRTGTASDSLWKGVYSVSATLATASIQQGMGVQSSSGVASMSWRRLWCWRMVMETRTIVVQRAATMGWL